MPEAFSRSRCWPQLPKNCIGFVADRLVRTRALSLSTAQPVNGSSFAELFRAPLRRSTLVITAMNAASLFAWWGLFSWVPSFLALPVAQGGHGLDIIHTATWTILMQAGTFMGYTSFGWLAERFGRKRVYIGYLAIAAAVVPLYALARSPLAVLWLGPVVGFWGTGYFSGFSVISSEAFPTARRGRAMGLPTTSADRLSCRAFPGGPRIGRARHWTSAGAHLSRIPRSGSDRYGT